MAQVIAGITRPVANFAPSLWGDQFIKYNYDAKAAETYSNKVEVLKNEVRGMITAPGIKMVDTMNLIDTLERLGVSYHFEYEIEQILQQFFDLSTDYNDEAYDLYTVATHFRLFRQHGHRISSDIFGRWRDENGKFQEGLKNNWKGLLSLYEASHLRTHGETILEEAVDFTTTCLKSVAPHLESPLREQVEHALVQPLHFGCPRAEAHFFISFYEEYQDKNELLLRFAKLDFNHLQLLHKKEVQELSRWWKELDLITKLPFARDRVVECYFWALGTAHEPRHSRARIFLTKTMAIISVTDDTYDAYGTLEELDLYTEAIQRWNIEEIKKLPEYMKPLYKAQLDLFEQFGEELAKEGRSYTTYYAIESLKEFITGYNVEAKWIQGYVPSFQEYIENALTTCGYRYFTTMWLLAVDSAVKEDFEWLSKKPKILEAGVLIGRVVDDAASYEGEKSRGQITTGIECYMKENNVTKEEAIAKFYEIAMDAWKDINEGCLMPYPHSRHILIQILNLARATCAAYEGNQDGYTEPQKVLMPHINALIVEPLQV